MLVYKDMWPAFLAATVEHVPASEKQIAVDKVRKQEHRELLEKGDKRLVGTRSIWRYAESNLQDRYHEQLEALRKMELKVGRAWAIKENLRLLWGCATQV